MLRPAYCEYHVRPGLVPGLVAQNTDFVFYSSARLSSARTPLANKRVMVRELRQVVRGGLPIGIATGA